MKMPPFFANIRSMRRSRTEGAGDLFLLLKLAFIRFRFHVKLANFYTLKTIHILSQPTVKAIKSKSWHIILTRAKKPTTATHFDKKIFPAISGEINNVLNGF
jgi:hypothetical protein